jgi:hypothetical protein
VWRGRPRQARLSQALLHCSRAPFDELATEVGELCGSARTSDIADAHVALAAAEKGGVLYTSDLSDLIPLIVASRGHMPVVIRC